MNTENAIVPIQPFESGQLLCLPSDCQAGLILQYRHHAGFAGAGAAVGGCLDIKSSFVYTIGHVHFCVPQTRQQRQQAYQKRIAYTQTLCKIASVNVPLQRAYLIVRQLCLWLDPEDVKSIPYELLGQLVGVLPKSIDAGWQEYLQHRNFQDSCLVSASSITRANRSSSQKVNPRAVQVPVATLQL